MAIGIVVYGIIFFFIIRSLIKDAQAKEINRLRNEGYERYLKSIHPDRDVALYLTGEITQETVEISKFLHEHPEIKL